MLMDEVFQMGFHSIHLLLSNQVTPDYCVGIITIDKRLVNFERLYEKLSWIANDHCYQVLP